MLDESTLGDCVFNPFADGVGLIFLSGAAFAVFCGLIKLTDIFLAYLGFAPLDFFIGFKPSCFLGDRTLEVTYVFFVFF